MKRSNPGSARDLEDPFRLFVTLALIAFPVDRFRAQETALTGASFLPAGAIFDATIPAYDKDTGKVLWEQRMPAGPEGIPAVLGVNGQDYLAFGAKPGPKHRGPGGERATGEASAEAPQTQEFYGFALPESGHNEPP